MSIKLIKVTIEQHYRVKLKSDLSYFHLMGTYGKIIQVYLKYGDVNRLKIAEIKNWTGQAFVVSRKYLRELLERDESKKIGVYFLIGTEGDQSSFYIGETEDFSSRIKNHMEKDYWNKVILFVNKDENLTKAHVQYLEKSLYRSLNEANRVVLMNRNVPNKGKLSEAEEDTMREFLDNIISILGVLGYPNIDRPIASSESENSRGVVTFFIRRKKQPAILAKMEADGESFVVLKDTQIVPDSRQIRERTLPLSIISLREQLIREGELVSEDNYLVLKKDVIFASPSSAAAFVLGRNSNGRTEWRTEDRRTYAEIEEGLLLGE